MDAFDATLGDTESPVALAAQPAMVPASNRRRAAALGIAPVVLGALLMVGSVSPANERRLARAAGLFDPGLVNAPRGAWFLVGAALLTLGRGLIGRRTLAFVLSAVVVAIAALAHASGHREQATVLALYVVVLVAERGRFAVVPAAGRLQRLWRPTAVFFVVGAAAAVELALHKSAMSPTFTWRLAGSTVASRATGAVGPLTVQGGPVAFFLATVTVAAAVIGIGSLAYALGPTDDRAGPDSAWLRGAVRGLVDREGDDTLDPFTLRLDKRHVVAAGNDAAVAYRCVLGVGLASGDPVGSQQARSAAVAAHLARCDANGWRPAVLGAREDRLGLYESHGLKAMYVGDEAVIDVATFSLAGGRMRNVRQAVNRSKNFGVTTSHHRQGELDPELRMQLVEVGDAWRADAPEMGFSMALDTLLSDDDPDCVIVVARDTNGEPIGFQRYVPCKGGRALSLDAMRRHPMSPNGINERMIVDTIVWGGRNGVDEVSLNFAAFRRVLEHGRRGLGLLVLLVFDRALPFVKIISLARFNSKFHPRWVPRYLVYRSPLDLPAVGLAALSAEGFLPFDRQRLGQRALG